MNQEQKNKIANELNKRIGNFRCPMCQKGPFVIVDGYFMQSVSDNMRSITIGGTSIPMTAVVCSNCGFVSFHALGALGMLNNQDDNANYNKQPNKEVENGATEETAEKRDNEKGAPEGAIT